MKKRKYSVTLRLTEEEKLSLYEKSIESNLTISNYVRSRVFGEKIKLRRTIIKQELTLMLASLLKVLEEGKNDDAKLIAEETINKFG